MSEKELTKEELEEREQAADKIVKSMDALVFPAPDEELSEKEKMFCLERVIRGASVQEAYLKAYDKEEGCSAAGVYPYVLLKKPKIKAYIAKLTEYKHNVRDMTLAMSDEIMSLEKALQLITKAANGEMKLTPSQLKALEVIIRVNGGYKAKEKPNKRPYNINIYTGQRDNG